MTELPKASAENAYCRAFTVPAARTVAAWAGGASIIALAATVTAVPKAWPENAYCRALTGPAAAPAVAA